MRDRSRRRRCSTCWRAPFVTTSATRLILVAPITSARRSRKRDRRASRVTRARCRGSLAAALHRAPAGAQPEGRPPPRRYPSSQAAPRSRRRDADLRQDPHGQNDNVGCRAERHDRQRQTKNPGQGGHPARPAATYFCWQTTGGRPYFVRLQHPEGIDLTFSTEIKRRHGGRRGRLRRGRRASPGVRRGGGHGPHREPEPLVVSGVVIYAQSRVPRRQGRVD